MTVLTVSVLMVISLALFSVVIMGIFYTLDFFLEIPYIATKHKFVSQVINFSGVKKGNTVVDLGSGDGRLLFEVAKRGAFGIGYEINPFLILLSKLKRYLKGYDQEIKIINKSVWNADLKVADVILIYSLKTKMKKFEDFVYKNAPKGTRVLVNTNPFPNKKPIKRTENLYLYVV